MPKRKNTEDGRQNTGDRSHKAEVRAASVGKRVFIRLSGHQEIRMQVTRESDERGEKAKDRRQKTVNRNMRNRDDWDF